MRFLFIYLFIILFYFCIFLPLRHQEITQVRKEYVLKNITYIFLKFMVFGVDKIKQRKKIIQTKFK